MTEMSVESICAYVPQYHSIFLHTNSEKSSKCRLEPTQTPTTSKKLCRRHGPIWPKLERHGVSSATCRDMSATFPAKPYATPKAETILKASRETIKMKHKKSTHRAQGRCGSNDCTRKSIFVCSVCTDATDPAQLSWKCRRHVATCRRRHTVSLQFWPDGSVSPTQFFRCRGSLCWLEPTFTRFFGIRM